MRTWKLGRVVAAIGIAALVLTACGSDDSSSDTTTSAGDTQESLSVSDAWTRSTPEDAVRSAVYLTVESNEDDEIVGASVPSDIAAMAELHETITGGADHDEGMDMDDDQEMDADHDESTTDHDATDHDHSDGATTMQAVDAIPVGPGATTLEPGGYHIMLMELAKPLTDGETFDLTLDFEHGGSKNVTVTVQSG